MPEAQDLQRLRKEYADRSKRLVGTDYYSPLNHANLFALQQRSRTLIRSLAENKQTELSKIHVLEIGCGSGGILLDFLSMGVPQTKLVGIDLLIERLIMAKQKVPLAVLANADGQTLPFAHSLFDLVIQFTAFSSVLDDCVKTNIAAEMLRVLKPDGMILWYDFWLNPTNRQTKGIRPPEIRKLFPNCSYQFHKITLAPPIARRLVPISWIAALLLEKLTLFNSHYLVVIRPPKK